MGTSLRLFWKEEVCAWDLPLLGKEGCPQGGVVWFDTINLLTMITNFLKIALRQIRKQRMYAFVKVGGFALGIAACLLIALFVRDELSYDKSWSNSKRLYRVYVEFPVNGKRQKEVYWPAPMYKALREDFAGVENAGRIMSGPSFQGAGSNQVRSPETGESIYEEEFAYIDQEMIDMLEWPMVYGNRKTALSEPNSLILSEEKAEKYFPGQDPVGKTLILNNDTGRPYKIGGVMKKPPGNSHIRYDFFLSLTGHQLWEGEQKTWDASNYSTYVLLGENTGADELTAKLPLIITKYYIPSMKANRVVDADELVNKARIGLQPLEEIHLYSYDINDGLEKGDVRIVWLFSGIAVFILLLASINFINLSTAKSANRAKEVGLRKVAGSLRRTLIGQFLTESILYTVFSFLLGLALSALLLPFFNELAGKEMKMPWMEWWLWPAIALASVVMGVLSGLYPSMYLSQFRPAQVLKGPVRQGSRNTVFRNGLVVFQFATSIVLIIGTIVIFSQMQLFLNAKVGYDKEQVLLVQGANTLGENLKPFKEELGKLTTVKNVSASDYLPVAGSKRDGNAFWKNGRTNEDVAVGAQKWPVDYDYIRTLGISIVEGRDFSRDMASDSAATIINRSMAKALGLENPVGQVITNGWQTFNVIGVAEDFNFESMREKVRPLCMELNRYGSSVVAVKLEGGQIRNSVASVRKTWNTFIPDQPFRYTFLDASYARMYDDVARTGRIFTVFAVLAIFIACLGLFALSAFMAEQRVKEIGIRKVLGASSAGIVQLLSGDYIKLVAIAVLIASPLAWWGMSRWLENFAYRIDMQWWMFVVAGSAAVMIALLAVSGQAIRAALANPVESLRNE